MKRWPLWAALALLLALASQLPALWRFGVATTMSLHALDQAHQWQSSGYWASPNDNNPAPSPEQWRRVLQSIQNAIEYNPDDAQLHEALALLHINHLRWHQPKPEDARAALEQAIELLNRANQLRPMSGHTWAAKALALYGLDTDPNNSQRKQALWQAFDLAVTYGQSQPNVQETLAHIAFAQWSELSAQRQAAIRQMAAQATPRQRMRITAIANSHGLSTF